MPRKDSKMRSREWLPTDAQWEFLCAVSRSDPRIVMVSAKESGLHYTIGNGGRVNKEMFKRLKDRGFLRSNRDGMIDEFPQSYCLNDPLLDHYIGKINEAKRAKSEKKKEKTS